MIFFVKIYIFVKIINITEKLGIYVIEIFTVWTFFQKTSPRENYWPASSHCQTISHNVVSNTPRHEQDSNSQLSLEGDKNTSVNIPPSKNGR
jgi:hypothetical protein